MNKLGNWTTGTVACTMFAITPQGDCNLQPVIYSEGKADFNVKNWLEKTHKND